MRRARRAAVETAIVEAERGWQQRLAREFTCSTRTLQSDQRLVLRRLARTAQRRADSWRGIILARLERSYARALAAKDEKGVHRTIELIAKVRGFIGPTVSVSATASAQVDIAEHARRAYDRWMRPAPAEPDDEDHDAQPHANGHSNGNAAVAARSDADLTE